MLQTFPRKLAQWLGWPGPSRSDLPRPGREPLTAEDIGTAVELFGRLAEITASVSGEVHQHNGSIQSVNDELTVIPPGDVAAVSAAVCKLLVLNEQTQRRLTQAELRLQAQQRQINDAVTAAKTDPLTGLTNRRGLDEALAAALADFRQKGRPATLFLLDVDQFKRFNDTHGHLAGDQALKRLSDVLLAQARESDVVARFGGEEFAVIFCGAKAAAVVQRAEKMRKAIGQAKFAVEGRELRITASGGLAEIHKDDSRDTLIKRADEALYAAKLDGRDAAYWHEGDRLQRVGPPGQEPFPPLEGDASPAERAESVELAAEQFADATFIGQAARRLAEWRRGGTTFSLVLARVAFPTDSEQAPSEEARRTAMRIVQQFARAVLRDMDIVTRWQEDGLAILLPGSLVTDAAGVANRLRAAIEKQDLPAPHGGLKLSLCAGVAEVIEGNDAQRVLRRAWQALDAARAAGRGNVFLHDGLRSSSAAAGAVI
jgi:diguanylate cyclase (GGDEF)-like protein